MKKLFLPLIVISFSVAVAQVRDNPDQLYRLAQTYEQAGHYKEANEIYKSLYEKNPASYSYFNGYTRTLTALKKYDEVISLCETKLERNPRDINTYGLLGSVYYLKNEREKAYEIWDEAIKRAGAHPTDYRIIANYAIQMRAFEKAIELLNEGKKKASSPELFNFDLATLYSMSMAYGKATREYCEILLLKPKQYYTIKNRIVSMLASENARKEIAATLEDCYEEHETAKLGELLAFVYNETGEYDKSFELIKKLDDEKNRNGALIFSFADESLRNNRFEVAAAAFDFLRENFPDEKFADRTKFGLAKALIGSEIRKTKNPNYWKPIRPRTKTDKRKFERAINLLTDVARNSRDRKTADEALVLLADLYFKHLGDYAVADSLYAEITRRYSSGKIYYDAVLARGKILLLSSRKAEKEIFERARKYFDEIAKAKKASAEIGNEATYFTAQTFYWEGKFAEAEKLFDKLSRKKTSDFANDAIDKKLLISVFKSDSVNSAALALADFYVFVENYAAAVDLLKKLSANENLFILNNAAKLKIAEIFIAQNKYPEAIKLLENLTENNLPEIFPDKALKELGDVYFYGLKDYSRAKEVYNKFLEKYENSLYINIIRENIKNINETENDGREKE